MTKYIWLRNEEGEWEGLYADGKLIVENHSLYADDVLTALKADFQVILKDDEWFADRDHRCPSRFDPKVDLQNQLNEAISQQIQIEKTIAYLEGELSK